MSSTPSASRSTRHNGDRTTKARIRDAAIESFAEHGVPSTTVRKVAAVAGVSPGLVIHHFDSMDGLRHACDEYVVSIIREQKKKAMSSGPNLDVLAALRDAEFDSLLAYLARVLVDDSDAVADLVDDLVRDAEGYIEDGVKAGMLIPSADPRGRAVVLMMWSLGALVLHRHLERLTGVDLTNPHFDSDPDSMSYVASVFEIYGNGILTDTFAANARLAFADMNDLDQRTEQWRQDEGAPSLHSETQGDS
jgi:AcrR family transcriptional regulator